MSEYKIKNQIEFRGIVTKDYNENFFNEEFVYGSLIYNHDDYESTIINDKFQAQVLTDTVGQYTGIKDTKDAKIFEDDILLLTSNKPKKYVVEYEEGEYVLYHLNDDLEKYELIPYSGFFKWGTLKRGLEIVRQRDFNTHLIVIGNIHQKNKIKT